MKLFSLTDFEIQTNEPYREREQKKQRGFRCSTLFLFKDQFTLSLRPRYWLVETCTGSVADRKKDRIKGYRRQCCKVSLRRRSLQNAPCRPKTQFSVGRVIHHQANSIGRVTFLTGEQIAPAELHLVVHQ